MGLVPVSDQEMHRKIDAVLDTVRPNIQMDGGDVQFVKFQDGAVYVRFEGACVGCPAAEMTLQMGIEQALKQEIPEVNEVIAVDEGDDVQSGFEDLF